jgi:hypothetical protein
MSATTTTARRSRALLAAVAALGLSAAPAAMAEMITVPQPWQVLAPLASQDIPAATCPASHPYLATQSFRRYGVSTPGGVDAENSKGIRVHVWVGGVGAEHVNGPATLGDSRGYPMGTAAGSQYANAMNWSFESAAYRIVLHCTNETNGFGSDADKTYMVTDRSLHLPTDPQAVWIAGGPGIATVAPTGTVGRVVPLGGGLGTAVFDVTSRPKYGGPETYSKSYRAVRPAPSVTVAIGSGTVVERVGEDAEGYTLVRPVTPAAG